MKLTNKQGISMIVMKPKAHCFCPLGNDWYTNELEITMGVGDCFPDYCDIEKFLDENVREKSLIIEDVVSMVYEYINNEYNPKDLTVMSEVNDVTSHSPVIVIKG